MDFIKEVIGTDKYTVEENKLRIIQETVPGNQVSLAHIIANPEYQVSSKLNVDNNSNNIKSAIGILSVTPPEVAIISGDLATKISNINLCDMDRFSGTIIISGGLSEVEAAFLGICDYLSKTHKFQTCPITKT